MAGVLKTYFRKLRPELISEAYFDQFMNITSREIEKNKNWIHFIYLFLLGNHPAPHVMSVKEKLEKGNKYSGFQAKWCKLLVALAQLLSHSGYSNAYDIEVWSHIHDILPIEAL